MPCIGIKKFSRYRNKNFTHSHSKIHKNTQNREKNLHISKFFYTFAVEILLTKQCKTHAKMNERLLLRSFLRSGSLNVEQSEAMKQVIFEACKMHPSSNKDRAMWSNWINGKNLPGGGYRVLINDALVKHGYDPLYDISDTIRNQSIEAGENADPKQTNG